MQDGCKVDMDSSVASNGSCFHGHLDFFQKPPLGGRPNTKPADHGTPNAHNRWFILFHHVWGPAWIEIHWTNIWWRARPHMTSHYTWGCVTTLHEFGGVLGQPLDTFFWALTFSRSWLLARVWRHPESVCNNCFSAVCVLQTLKSISGTQFVFLDWTRCFLAWVLLWDARAQAPIVLPTLQTMEEV